MQTINLSRNIINRFDNILHIKSLTQNDNYTFRINVNENIDDWTIKARLYDDYRCFAEIQATEVMSGVSGEVEIEDLENGIFLLNFEADLTGSFSYIAHLEIEIIDANGKKETILSGDRTQISMNSDKII